MVQGKALFPVCSRPCDGESPLRSGAGTGRGDKVIKEHLSAGWQDSEQLCGFYNPKKEKHYYSGPEARRDLPCEEHRGQLLEQMLWERGREGKSWHWEEWRQQEQDHTGLEHSVAALDFGEF